LELKNDELQKWIQELEVQLLASDGYRKHDEIVRRLDGDDAFFCLFCYGKKKIDFVEFVMGNYEQDLKDRKVDLESRFLDSLKNYLYFLIKGQVEYDYDEVKWKRYDAVNRGWRETAQAIGSVKGQKDAAKLMLKAIDDGYTDKGSYNNFIMDEEVQYDLQVYHVELIGDIKTELIDSTEMTVARLERIKEELEWIGISIEELRRFQTKKNSEKNLPPDFKFNYENILERFNFSIAHLPALNRLSNKKSTLKFILPNDDENRREIISTLPLLNDIYLADLFDMISEKLDNIGIQKFLRNNIPIAPMSNVLPNKTNRNNLEKCSITKALLTNRNGLEIP
jgi:hypothetical protein